MVLPLMASRLLTVIPHALRHAHHADRASSDHEAGRCRCSADCPMYGSASLRVNSNYTRKLRDVPSHGRMVTIHLAARPFRCLNAACVRNTFAECLDDAGISTHRTKRLGDLQRHLGLALGGEAGTLLQSGLLCRCLRRWYPPGCTERCSSGRPLAPAA
jgi:hypothetical protein